MPGILDRLRGNRPARDRDGDPSPGEDGAVAMADGGTATESVTAEPDSRLSGFGGSDLLESLPFWLPPALLMGWFVYGAIGWNFVISLTDWDGLGRPSYASLDFGMYARMFSDPTFWNATKNTVVLIVGFTVICLALGLVLAILVDQDIRYENTFRTVYLLPMALSFVVTAKFWAWIYNSEIGLINVTLRQVGLGFLAQSWLGDPRLELGSIIFALIWQFSGYAMVVYLAGLRAIPTDHFEAARVDGASTVRMYWRVVLPQLRTSTVSAAVVLIVFALKAFDFIFVLAGKNPGPASDILAIMMYREAFSALNWAYGSAIAVVLFCLALLIIGPYLYSEYRRGEL